jgi:hypothetical protein
VAEVGGRDHRVAVNARGEDSWRAHLLSRLACPCSCLCCRAIQYMLIAVVLRQYSTNLYSYSPMSARLQFEAERLDRGWSERKEKDGPCL